MTSKRNTNNKHSKLSVPGPPQPELGTHFMGAFKDKENRLCDICHALELPNADTHTTAMCFGNPENPNHKHATYATRLKQAKDKGVYIPELYPKPENLNETKT
jgi:hypothetical protein